MRWLILDEIAGMLLKESRGRERELRRGEEAHKAPTFVLAPGNEVWSENSN